RLPGNGGRAIGVGRAAGHQRPLLRRVAGPPPQSRPQRLYLAGRAALGARGARLGIQPALPRRGGRYDRRMNTAPVLVFGLDGADFDIVEELLAAGRMPTIARLRAAGAFGPLRSTEPPITPV